ncbi:MAG: ATP-binding protein, partial [Planctomycetota bacterium]
ADALTARETERRDFTIAVVGPETLEADLPDPTAEANLDKCSGRGLLLIEAYMTSVNWSDDGKTIRMEKVNDTSGPSLP